MKLGADDIMVPNINRIYKKEDNCTVVHFDGENGYTYNDNDILIDEGYTEEYKDGIDVYNNLMRRIKAASNDKLYKEEVANDMDSDKSYDMEFNSISRQIRDMENRLREDRVESEKRIEEQRKLSENRIEERYKESLKNTQDSESRIEKRFDQVVEYHIQSEKRINEKYDAAMESIKDQDKEIKERFDKFEDKYEHLKWWILGTCLATIIAIASMIYSKG